MSTPSDITKAAEEIADNVLKAAGSALRHHTMPKGREAIIGAAVKGLEAWQSYKESVNRATDADIARAEREKCATIVAKQADAYLPGGPVDMKELFRSLAAAIRKGSD